VHAAVFIPWLAYKNLGTTKVETLRPFFAVALVYIFHPRSEAKPRRLSIFMDGQYSELTKLGLGALTFNSALAVYNSGGDAGSVAFVLAADAALLLLFLCLREFERAGRVRHRIIKAAAWVLTTLLTVMTCNWTLADAGSAAIVFVAYVGLLTTIILFLGELNHRAHSVEHGQHEVEDPSAAHGDVRVEVASTDLLMALFMTAFSVLTCDWALVIHKTCSDMASKVFVFAAYAILLTTVSLFLSKLARIVPALPGAGVVDAAHGDVCVEDGAAGPIHGGIE
jgi:hypothetical protein